MKSTCVVMIAFMIDLSCFGQSSRRDLIRDESSRKIETINSFDSEFQKIEKEYYKNIHAAIQNNKDIFRTKQSN